MSIMSEKVLELNLVFPTPIWTSFVDDYQTINKKRLMMYLKTFIKLHNLHQKQYENLRKVVENHEKRIIELTSEVVHLRELI